MKRSTRNAIVTAVLVGGTGSTVSPLAGVVGDMAAQLAGPVTDAGIAILDLIAAVARAATGGLS